MFKPDKLKPEQLKQQFSLELDAARSAFAEAAAGKTVCQLGRDNIQNLPLKALEGRMQALTDVSRCLQQSDLSASLNCLHNQLQRWQKLSELSGDWLVYKKAGIEAIDSALQRLSVLV
jgi:hypothetical protein